MNDFSTEREKEFYKRKEAIKYEKRAIARLAEITEECINELELDIEMHYSDALKFLYILTRNYEEFAKYSGLADTSEDASDIAADYLMEFIVEMGHKIENNSEWRYDICSTQN